MGINKKHEISFSNYENKLREWWKGLDENEHEDDLREKKRLILLLAHPTFKNDMNLCIEKIHEIGKRGRDAKLPLNLEIVSPQLFGGISDRWQISFSSGFYNYVIKNKCKSVDSLDSEVLKHIVANDIFFNVRALGAGFRSLNGFEVSRLLASKSGGFKNSVYLEVNLNSPNVTVDSLWLAFQHEVKRMLQHKVVKISAPGTDDFKNGTGSKNIRLRLLSHKRFKELVETKFNEGYTGIRLSKKKGTTANRKSFNEIFNEISKLRLNLFERDLILHYLRLDPSGGSNTIESIFKEGEFEIKIGKSSKRWYDKIKNLYYFVDPMLAAPDFVSSKTKRGTRKS